MLVLVVRAAILMRLCPGAVLNALVRKELLIYISVIARENLMLNSRRQARGRVNVLRASRHTCLMHLEVWIHSQASCGHLICALHNGWLDINVRVRCRLLVECWQRLSIITVFLLQHRQVQRLIGASPL